MRRREPPRLAVWTLEHLTSGERDEGLAGDLLEAFESGRSSRWYWRQTLMACAVSWSESIRERSFLLVFVLLWSMAAPGWNAVCIIIENCGFCARLLSTLEPTLGPIAALLALIGWTILHSIFLWGGLLIFSVLHIGLGGSFHPAKFKRAFLLAAAIFVPSYGLVVLAVLCWFSFVQAFQVPISPVAHMANLSPPEDLLRAPYLLALLGALWGSIRRTGRIDVRWLSAGTGNTAADSEALDAGSSLGSFIATHWFWLMAAAGLINVAIAGLLLCQLPDAHFHTLTALLVRGTLYVLASLLAGVGGTYLYWKNPTSPIYATEPLPFLLFALVCAAGWVWIPAAVLLLEQQSPASPLIALVGAYAFTVALRRVSSCAYEARPLIVASAEQSDSHLFAESLYPPPGEAYGHAIALGLYGGVAAWLLGSYFMAAVLFVFAASVFAWKKTLPLDRDFNRGREKQRAALRLPLMLVPALLVTVWALLGGVAHRNALAEANAQRATNSPAKEVAISSHPDATALGADGFESVILWPYPDKRPVLPSIVPENAQLPSGSKEPLVIRFNGPYWYFQPPQKSPGSSAHMARGTPIAFDIRSSNAVPLVMEAHQFLSASIPIERCREIDVDVENRDNVSGEVSLGVLLAAGVSTKDSALYLGEQPILSTRPENFTVKHVPVFETLRFSIPVQAKIHNFHEITILVFPDIEHTFDAPKIAIQQFQIYPR